MTRSTTALPIPETGNGAGIALAVRNDIHRYGLEGMLRSLDIVSATYSYTTVEEASAAAATLPIDLLLTSTIELGETQAATMTRLRGLGVRLMVLLGPEERVEQAWAAHAHGFLDRSALHLRTVRDAVEDIRSDRFHVSASLARRLLVPGDTPPSVALTGRELQVLQLVAEGLSNKLAARALGISENGVKRLMGNVLAKLNSPNRTLAVVRALEIGLIRK
ncbi:helix-turn-helix transcriptional regulator [Nocardia jejuensis]|uniref:helix-turn-helix transcriptional regulator n=1 Tax=Nocardia jejuensis TaxID=328049 RepID=UPI0008322AF9|nr:response regulator transcription factor [Nocardia jejuensis]